MSPSGPTYYTYHCSACKQVTKQPNKVLECVACHKPLCPRCMAWGLCPTHYVSLPLQDQRMLQRCYNEQKRVESRINFLGGFICVSIFMLLLSVFYGTSNSGPKLETVVEVLLVSLSLLMMLWAIVRIWQARYALARARLGYYAILHQHPAFATVNWRDAKIDVKKEMAFLRSGKATAGEEGSLEIEVPKPPPLVIKAAPLPYYGKCGICGTPITTNEQTMGSGRGQCLVCHTLLCQAHNKSGVCLEHYQALTPQHQHDLQVFYKERGLLQHRIDYGLVKYIFLLILVGFGLIPIALWAYYVTSQAWGWAVLVYLVVLTPLIGLVARYYHRLLAEGTRLMAVAETILQQYPALVQEQARSVRLSISVPGSSMDFPPHPPPLLDVAETEDIPEVPFSPEQSPPSPVLDDPTAIEQWKDLVATKFPVRYCPHCKIDHPAFARYCILCGKPLPEPK